MNSKVKNIQKRKDKRTKLVPTKDNFFPNFPGDMVKVSWHNNEFRVSVWGDDDMGLEKYFDNKIDAENCFNELVKSNNIQIKELKKLGFAGA